MNPRARRPVWIEHVAAAPAPALAHDIAVDVAVIGAGITGLTTALLLVREGLSVAVLERGQLGHGATAHTSGHLTAVLDIEFGTLVKRFGEDGARTAVSAGTQAIDAIGHLAIELGVDAGLQHLPGYRFARDRADADRLAEEAEVARQLGLRASLVREAPLPFPIAAAIRFEDQAVIHPLHYVAGLLRAVLAGGGQVFAETPVLDLETDEPCTLRTPAATVTARHVVQATHAPLGLQVLLQARLRPAMSYVLCARLAGTAPAALCWDTEDPYHYYRPLVPGSDRLIAGGLDHKTGQDEDGVSRFSRLEEHVRAGFDVQAIEREWCAEVFEPADGLPYVGRIGDGPMYVATGFAGNGLTWGTSAAGLLRDLMTGTPNPLQALLDPGRLKPLASAREVVSENLNAAWHMVRDRLMGPDVETAASILPGQGRLVEIDGHRAAVYRDERAELHVMSPVCTHLGCIVHWNADATTWDCPCHGGRFLPTGEVLCSPPTADLQRRS